MTRQEAEIALAKFQGYQKRYKGYPGSPGDDALLGIFGYTVRDERGYINRQIKKLKAALSYMDKQGRDNITDREYFYL